MNRRKLLLSSGAALTATLAGCSSDDTSNRETGNTDETDSEDNSERETGDSSTDTSSNSSSDGNGNSSEGESEEQLVELLEHEWYNDGDFNSGVQGQVENVSGETLGYVEVSVYFLDSEGVQISEGLDNTSDLAAGRVWEFDAMFTGDDPSRVENYEIETSVDNF